MDGGYVGPFHGTRVYRRHGRRYEWWRGSGRVTSGTDIERRTPERHHCPGVGEKCVVLRPLKCRGDRRGRRRGSVTDFLNDIYGVEGVGILFQLTSL